MEKIIDMNTYNRRQLYENFLKFEIPVFSLTVNVDITHFMEKIKKDKLRFFSSLCYQLMKTCNEIIQFRHRIVENKLVEFDIVHPNFTCLKDELVFFCSSEYCEDFKEFYDNFIFNHDNLIKKETLKNNVIYITSNHFTSFTAFTHAYSSEINSVPLITIGKYFKNNDSLIIPISLQVHHSIMDGLHVGKFYNNLQENLNKF